MIITEQELRQLFTGFNSCKVLIVGDVMIDSYLIGNVDRISPEAPVPVVALKERNNMLGGAANVALNIKAMGAGAMLCSVIGNDKQGDLFLELMQKMGLSCDGIIRSKERITTTKFRIISHRTQMLRVDEEMDSDLSKTDSISFIEVFKNLLSEQKPDVIILQDYNKGVLTPAIISQVIGLANEAMIPVGVDPKKKNFAAYRNVTLFKPNLKEITEGLKLEINPKSSESLRKAADILHTDQELKHLMITLSENGIFVSSRNTEGNHSTCIPAEMRSIADVSGAGDTVISVASLCLALGTNPILMTSLANLAGGLVCEKPGVVPVDKNRLLDEAITLLT